MSSEDRQSGDDPEDESSATDGTTDSIGDGGSAEERTDNPREEPPIATEATQDADPFWKQLVTANDGPLLFLRELLLSLSIVAIIGIVLFAVSGIWPPMVAVESNSMEPHINKYDLVFVTEPGRFAPPNANQQGLIMAETGDQGHVSFGRSGSVIVYDEPNTRGSPIIHRARFAVDQGENWYDEANPDAISANSCQELQHCPAEYAGYITKGDNNGQYDQANGIAPIVRPGWIQGVAKARIPYLGRLRLALLGTATSGLRMQAGTETMVSSMTASGSTAVSGTVPT
jgi:signal peptidase